MKALNTIKAGLELIRLPNVLIAAANGFAAFWLVAPVRTWNVRTVLCGLFALALFCAGGNAVNDFFDADIDRVNRPGRPLPSGRLSGRAALILAIVTFVSGLILSFLLGGMAFRVGAGAVVLLVAYSVWLKRVLVAGNVAVGLIAALTFPFIGAVFNKPFAPALVFPSLFIFLFHLGREIIKDAVDVAGDRAVGAKTIPIVFGRKAALAAAAIPFIILIPVTALPFVLGIYGVWYLAAVGLAVDTVLAGIIIRLFMNPDDRTLNRLSAVLKLDMLGGLAALLVTRL